MIEVSKTDDMTLEEEIKAIRYDWKSTTAECRDRFKKALENALSHIGFLGVDVCEKRSGKKGRLRVLSTSPCGIDWDIVFFPYKKDGTLSSRGVNEYVFTYDNFDERMQRCYSKVGDADGKSNS